jgi:hypothetical protein
MTSVVLCNRGLELTIEFLIVTRRSQTILTEAAGCDQGMRKQNYESCVPEPTVEGHDALHGSTTH